MTMKYYVDPTNNDIYAYAADGSDDAFVKEGLTLLTGDELAALRAAQTTAADLAADGRAWRDAEVTASQWLVERHRDQVETSTATTLTTEQYSALQVYRQALRDWPTADGFPADSSRPAAPDWLAAAEAEASA